MADADGLADAERSTLIYVARRSWHIDIGFAAQELHPPLDGLRAKFPGARYLFFGFGDRRYLEAKHHTAPVLASALWSGAGLMLVTALNSPPQEAFGADQVIALPVTEAAARDMQAFVAKSIGISTQDSPARTKAVCTSTPSRSIRRFTLVIPGRRRDSRRAAFPSIAPAWCLPGNYGNKCSASNASSQAKITCRVAWCHPGKRPSFRSSEARPRWWLIGGGTTTVVLWGRRRIAATDATRQPPHRH